MAITTKSALADELGITRARVSQYVKQGLPVRSDGKLNRDEALNWIARTQASQTFDDKGANRARHIVRQPRRRTVSVDRRLQDPAEIEIAVRLVAEVGRIVAETVVKAGGSLETAFTCDQMVAIALDRVASDILARRGYEGFPDISCLERAGRDIPEADWPALARQAGSVFNEDACTRHLDAVMFPPGWQPPSSSPAARLKEPAHG